MMTTPTTTIDLQRIIKWIFGFMGLFLASCILISAITFIIYYQREVRPYHVVVEQIITNADPEHLNLSTQMQTMIDADFYCGDSPKSRAIFSFNANCGMIKEGRVARLVQDHTLAEDKPRRTLINHLHHIMLSYCIVRPLSQNEQNILISELTFFTPEAKSFNQFSMFYFHEPLNHLTLDEVATLVAFTKAPSSYLQDNERLKLRQQVLLARYQTLTKKVEF